MKQFEHDFIRWAFLIMKERLPLTRVNAIYNDLAKSLENDEISVKIEKLNSFHRMMMLAFRANKELLTEIFNHVKEIKDYYNGTKEYKEETHDLIFSIDMTYGKTTSRNFV